MRIKALRQRGDTIVEVLMAITVMSIVLAGAYSITTRSLANIRQAQEHTIALKLAESQIEQLKQVATNKGLDNNGNKIFTFGANFCMLIISNSPQITNATPPPPNSCTVTNGINYEVSISRTDTTAKMHRFNVLVHWPSIRGGQDDQVSLVYNLNE